MSINKPSSRFDMLLGLAFMGLVLVAVSLYAPEKPQQKPELFVACFLAGEPVFSGPVTAITTRDGGNIVVVTPQDGQRLELINGECLIVSAPD